MVDNGGTGHGLQITQNASLASDKHALFVYTNSVQSTDNLVTFHIDGTAGNAVLETIQDGTGPAITVVHTGASGPSLLLALSGSGKFIDTDSGGSTSAHLSNAGVWTDEVATIPNKELEIVGFIDKLKTLKLYEYQKDIEVYGKHEIEILGSAEDLTGDETKYKDKAVFRKNGKVYKIENGKKHQVTKQHPMGQKNPNARTYKGIVLLDPTTPDELIARELDGSVAGRSANDGVDFLLAVCKELILRIEALETP